MEIAKGHYEALVNESTTSFLLFRSKLVIFVVVFVWKDVIIATSLWG